MTPSCSSATYSGIMSTTLCRQSGYIVNYCSQWKYRVLLIFEGNVFNIINIMLTWVSWVMQVQNLKYNDTNLNFLTFVVAILWYLLCCNNCHVYNICSVLHYYFIHSVLHNIKHSIEPSMTITTAILFNTINCFYIHWNIMSYLIKKISSDYLWNQ